MSLTVFMLVSGVIHNSLNCNQQEPYVNIQTQFY